MSEPSRPESPVVIVGGTGALGFGLALRLARAGVPVVIGSRRAESAAESAERLSAQLPDARVEGLPNEQAVARGGTVIVTVPFRSHAETLGNIREALSAGQILVDTTVPLAAATGGRATRMLGVPQGSAAEQAAEMAPDSVTVVSGLHTVSADRLRRLDERLGEDVPLAGDDRDAKRAVAELIRRIDGLRPVDAGRLEMSRFTEGLTPLLISVNVRHKTHAGIRFTGVDEPRW